MARKRKVGKIERKKGMLYYVDAKGNIWEAPLQRGRKKRKK